MKKYILTILSIVSLCLTSCDDILDRPSETSYTDDNFWTTEEQYRQYFNYYYTNYFTGYNSAFNVAFTPVRGYTFSDDYANSGKQSNFTETVPSSNGSYTLLNYWIGAEYGGQGWNFAWIRKTNILINRLESHKSYLTSEAYNHWMGIARFFRAYEYYRLVMTFGDVPYWDSPVDETDLASMYKDRDPRSTVTDAIYEDLKYALSNVRESDGTMNINRYVIAAVASNIMLFEGTWQYYHKNNTLEASSNLSDDNAKKYLQLCIDASEIIMNSGKWSCTSDFRSLFGSDDLSSNPEVIFYRQYIEGMTTHCLGSYSNGYETISNNANLALLRSFICNDSKPYQVSSVENAANFSMKELSKTRDPRFEATFLNLTWKQSSTYAYQDKFISRKGASYYNNDANRPDQYESSVNVNDAPCLRLSEVLLNWIEAKEVMAEFFGGTAVTQSDIDKSINVIRDRPLDATAIANGVQKTAHLKIASIVDDPSRDTDVSTLMWEIRRERRMEFAFEGQRMNDIRRWFKLSYMDNNTYPETMMGSWVDFPKEAPELLDAAHIKTDLSVIKADGSKVKWDGSNQDEMVGYALPTNATARNNFSNKNYLCPIGTSIIATYKNKGFTLTQTGGWE
ncbi:MAG: RagB/SusD family nutrient uptake outer membrane protein [Bacteroides graminisolvens]|nr:RagB/SusD family nutrient uptake outer membrane protein [Bacteroides graminisolvens]MCD8496296.1 RagB/SusD family nutrient uptake outer membrane protein [Bacteroides graminisolvens]MCD8573427.1 RagB/SusD family nutrient uptake outer membrane protein [Bacteroides graminisolvens]